MVNITFNYIIVYILRGTFDGLASRIWTAVGCDEGWRQTHGTNDVALISLVLVRSTSENPGETFHDS